MKTITKTKTAYQWLRAEAEKVPTKRNALYLFDSVYDHANGYFDQGEPMPGLEFEFWLPITEGLVDHPGRADTVQLAEPIAVFVSELLADLATRGAGGRVPVEQAIIMLLDALDWCDCFELRAAKDGLQAFIKSRPRFEQEHGVAFAIPVPREVQLDLPFQCKRPLIVKNSANIRSALPAC